MSFFNEYIKNTNGNINSFEELVESGEYIQDLPSYEECCNDSLESFYNYKTKHLEYKEYVENQMERCGVDVLAYPTTKNEIATLDDANVTSPSFAISPVTGMPAISIPMGFSQDKLPYGIEVLVKRLKPLKLIYFHKEPIINLDL
jgi:aspartyl-tRNA(Asn)/glutamyl-tRNA(Gln) amidotransferase subunit A